MAADAASVSKDFEWQNGSIKLGTLVALKRDNPKSVEQLNVNNKDYAIGVVVENGRALLSLSISGEASVNVATDGEVVALVSDINGSVKKGDFVGASTINGVAMKLDEESTESQRLVGIALGDFDSNQSISIENGSINGGSRVLVGYLPITLINKDKIPSTVESKSGLETVATKLAGKDVSIVRVLIALVIFCLSMVSAAMIIRGSLKGSFISLGRNPLASNSIYTAIIHVTILSTVLILIGSALSYAVLVWGG